MKKYFYLFFISSITSFNCFSQDATSVSLSLGTGIPVRAFASKNNKGDSAGVAQIGGVTDISVSYKLLRNFGFTGMLRGQINGSNAQALSDSLNKTQPSVQWSVSGTSWKMIGLMAGCFGDFKISKNWNCHANVLIGVLDVTCPEYTTTGTSANGNIWTKQYKSSSSAFALLAGIGLKRKIKDKYFILFKADYYYSYPEFNNVEIDSSVDYPKFTNINQKIESVNVSVGFGITL